MGNDREELLKRADDVSILPMLSGMMTEVFRIMDSFDVQHTRRVLPQFGIIAVTQWWRG